MVVVFSHVLPAWTGNCVQSFVWLLGSTEHPYSCIGTRCIGTFGKSKVPRLFWEFPLVKNVLFGCGWVWATTEYWQGCVKGCGALRCESLYPSWLTGGVLVFEARGPWFKSCPRGFSLLFAGGIKTFMRRSFLCTQLSEGLFLLGSLMERNETQKNCPLSHSSPVTCRRSVVSSGYSGFLHQKTDFIIIISPSWYDPGCCWGVKPQLTPPPKKKHSSPIQVYTGLCLKKDKNKPGTMADWRVLY